MAIDPELKAILDQQAKQMDQQAKQHKEQMDMLAGLFQKCVPTAVSTPSDKTQIEITIQSVYSKLDKFYYVPGEYSFFDIWYRRHESVFTQEAKDLTDSQKITILTQKLENQVFDQLANYVAPKKLEEFKFYEVISTLTTLFGNKATVFSERFSYIRMNMEPGEDVLKLNVIKPSIFS